MRILRNGKVTDPAEENDWREICARWGHPVADIFEQIVEAATTPMRPYAGNRALRTMAFDLALTDYDRAWLRSIQRAFREEK